MPDLISQHNYILKTAIEEHNGFVFQMVGDSFSAAFHNPSDALNAAVDGQRALSIETWSPAPIKVRMGFHTGEAQLDDENNESRYSGYAALALTQRVMSAGHGGQTLISKIVHDSLENNTPENIQFVDKGTHRLKGFTELTHFYQVNVPELQEEFPRLNTLDVSPNNLPNQLNRFIGRESEMKIIKDMLDVARLVTLTGSGGAGKTRLSLEVAEALQDANPHGVWFVELASQTDPAAVPQTIASALGIIESEEVSVQNQLQDFCKKRKLLIVLDNCEHLIEACAEVANSLLRACPDLRILASSREALGVPGEAPYRVPSLRIPDPEKINDLEEFQAIEAVQLFTERAKSSLPDFALTSENAPTIARICQRLDGIPLAIELASARVKVLSVEQIAERLDDRFRLLTGGSRTALPRQQTLRALIDWSYGLLSDQEKTLLRRLSVFSNGWDLEAAEAICADEKIDSYEILDLLTSLVDKSLVITEQTEIGVRYHIRYRRLETIRQYAREKFLETDEVETRRNAHLAYFVQMAEAAEADIDKPEVITWLKRLDHNSENIFSAIAWAVDSDVTSGLRIVSALFRYWEIKEKIQEPSIWFTRLAEKMDESIPPSLRAKAYYAGYAILYFSGDYQEELNYIEKSLALYESLQDHHNAARTKMFKAYKQFNSGDVDKSEMTILENLSYYEQVGDKNGMADCYSFMSGSLYSTRDIALALSYGEKSLALFEETGNRLEIKYALYSLIRNAFWVEKLDDAQEYLERIWDLEQKMFIPKTSFLHQMEGRLCFYAGNYECARIRFLESLEIDEASGRKSNMTWSHISLALIGLREGDLQEASHRLLASVELLPFTGNNKIATIFLLEVFSELSIHLEKTEPAARLLAWADINRIDIGDPRPQIEQKDVDKLLEIIQTELVDETLAEAKSAGEKMTYEEALAYALQEIKL
jgi:predicted ATPase